MTKGVLPGFVNTLDGLLMLDEIVDDPRSFCSVAMYILIPNDRSRFFADRLKGKSHRYHVSAALNAYVSYYEDKHGSQEGIKQDPTYRGLTDRL